MKHLLIAFVAIFAFTAVKSQAKKPTDITKFSTETVDLGKPKVGNPVTATFTFTNTSKPGKTGTITATYNAAAVGNFTKQVRVKFLGIDQEQVLTITGQVQQ
jgi:hypothetical protein